VKILAIETSCDETSLALVKADGGDTQNPSPRFKIEKVLTASQINIHRPFGGVVPNLAKREHQKNLPILYRKIFGEAVKEKKLWKEIDLIAVTVGPGLEPALWAGITFAEELAKKHKKQLVGANHLEGHLYSFLLTQKNRIMNYELRIKNKKREPTIHNSQFIIQDMFPAVALIVSGGHTILLKMYDLFHWGKIGETRDDAVGEAYDKVARLLGLPYPGGPEIEKLARSGNPKAIDLPRPMIYHKNYDFSFSGLKTAVRYYAVNHPELQNSTAMKADLAASFQEAALDVLASKTAKAAEEIGAETVMVSGGVSINKALRARFKKDFGKKFNLYFPKREFCNDNAAMIAVAAYIKYIQGRKYRPAAQANLNM
jgi:N6-L-threonylcarbamoyladenine synthase